VRTFSCDRCGQLVYFDNSLCLHCDAPLGYRHDRRRIVALNPGPDGTFDEVANNGSRWRRCATAEATGCNWLVPADTFSLCDSCGLTRTRPDYEDEVAREELARAEGAKRRLVFQLADLGLPLSPWDPDIQTGVAFDLLSSSETTVTTGHQAGVITLDLAEADSEHRERLRLQLSEPYRTLLGHYRHEIGHYLWPKLVDQADRLAQCRALFGDERADYAEALRRHYAASKQDDLAWQDQHISRYATMHPAEDWAETFAHYLHILDTLQTAENFGLGTGRSADRSDVVREQDRTPTRPDGSATFDDVIAHWLELTYALNQINRSMGQPDLYPFVVAPRVMDKLDLVDRLVRAHAHVDDATGSPESAPAAPLNGARSRAIAR
jgi:hypothetical protein